MTTMRAFPHFVAGFSAALFISASSTLQAEPQEAPGDSENIASQQLKKLEHVFSPNSTNAEQSLKKDLADSRIQKAQDMMDDRQTAALDPKATHSSAKVK